MIRSRKAWAFIVAAMLAIALPQAAHAG